MSALLSLAGDAVTVQRTRAGGATTIATKNQTGWSNGLVMTKDNVRGTATARFSFVVASGRASTIGVCCPDISWTSYLNQTTSGWGLFVHTGCIGHDGPAEQRCVFIAVLFGLAWLVLVWLSLEDRGRCGGWVVVGE